MESNRAIFQGIEFIAIGIEILGVAVIGFAFPFGIIRSVIHHFQKKSDAFRELKIYIGKSLQLGLEFLIAADVIKTVTIEPTMNGLLSLGLLIVIRTVLSWSIILEIEGCWPWNISKERKE